MNFTGDAIGLHLGFLLQCTVTVQSATMKLCLEFITQDWNGKNTSVRKGFIVIRIDNCYIRILIISTSTTFPDTTMLIRLSSYDP